jgi:16S rRNA (adenine1518-N6/adenine1519-N6)-dimethyltransferase
MPQTKSQIQQMLTAADAAPRHRFGQNFMIDGNLVRAVAAAGRVQPGDTVIEVGPGTGTLTDELLASPAGRVVAVEIDHGLARLLRERFAGNGRFHLIEGDALAGKHELNPELLAVLAASPDRSPAPCRLVANLPYNIASPLVIELLRAGVDTLAFTVQKEVADRLKSTGGEGYGPLSVMANLLAEVEVLRTLPPQAFWPAPKIDSALVRMTRRNPLGEPLAERSAAVGRFVAGLFSARRKTLRKAMEVAGIAPAAAAAALANTGVDPTARPETLPPPALLRLFDAVAAMPRSRTN